MTNQPSIFKFESHAVRVIVRDGEPWFVAADVLNTLTLDRKALERLDADEKGVSSIHTLGGDQEMTVVNEPGLYGLVLGSRKPEARHFKRWVKHEVLPAIRKTGSYSVNPVELSRMDILKLAMESEQARLEAESKLAIAAPKAEALDRITLSDGAMCITNAAKTLGLGPKRLFAWLQEKGWIYRRAGGSGFVGYQSRIQVGYLDHKITLVTRSDGSEKTVEQVLVTPKGLAKLAEVLNVQAAA